MNRAVAHLQDVDVSRNESWFVTEGRTGTVHWFLGNDFDAVVFFECGDIIFDQKDRNFDGDGRAVVQEHEALKARMSVVIGADARNDERRRVGRRVLLFEDDKAVEGEKSRRQLRGSGGHSWCTRSRKSAIGAKRVLPLRRSSRVPARMKAVFAL